MKLNSLIDHTVLRQDTSLSDVTRVCNEAIQYGFAAVCIPPSYVKIASELLRDSEVKVSTVVGFPFGYQEWGTKELEILLACEKGADELDMVMNVAAAKDGDWKYIENEILSILPLVRQYGKTLKVIIESGILTDAEIIHCCRVYSKAGVDFVKTSTGFAEKGATVEAVKLLREHLPHQIQIKASGGIRTYAFAKALVDAGASRLGSNSSVDIIMDPLNLEKK